MHAYKKQSGRVAPVMLASAIVLAGCDRLPPRTPEIANCWAPDTKTKIQEMFHAQVTDYIMKMIDDGTTAANKKDAPTRNEIDGRVTVNLDTVHATAADAASGSLTCGANIVVKFRRRGDEKVMTASATAPDFRIFKGETGPVFSVPAPIALAPLMDKLGKDGE
ncbi:hypothetical protein LMG6871_02861 [Ralstonia edaphis]|uniref:hypothetical protein n=1 Tax=Ralstonia edaphi TaxID=3058599 RepID=UPI0028F5C478|nr:hypothetical protein [Ralstonia sp. LMG 6871]CAJ0719434.1 hypothetical protein LMG6871_02861 [Ralstonia sp. LMG 6871]